MFLSVPCVVKEKGTFSFQHVENRVFASDEILGVGGVETVEPLSAGKKRRFRVFAPAHSARFDAVCGNGFCRGDLYLKNTTKPLSVILCSPQNNVLIDMQRAGRPLVKVPSDEGACWVVPQCVKEVRFLDSEPPKAELVFEDGQCHTLKAPAARVRSALGIVVPYL